jgi:hypothetical protein
MKTESEIRKRFEEVSRDLEKFREIMKRDKTKYNTNAQKILYAFAGSIAVFEYILDDPNPKYGEMIHDRK